MDPNITLQRFIERCREHHEASNDLKPDAPELQELASEAREALENLYRWVMKGGFLPTPDNQTIVLTDPHTGEPQDIIIRRVQDYGIEIAADGYGTADMQGGAIIYIEHYDDRVTLRAWPDVNDDSNVHTVDFTTALESARRPELPTQEPGTNGSQEVREEEQDTV